MISTLEKRINDVIIKINNEENLNLKWIAKNLNVESITQNGPQCGIVGLCMGLNHLGIKSNVNELMKESIENGFTKNGEMFDIKYLQNIGNKYYEHKLKILKLENQDDEIHLLEKILNSKLALIAYDCDFNFEPCNKNGSKAHWALITGFLIPDGSNLGNQTEEENAQIISILNQNEELSQIKLDNILKNYSQYSQKIYFICKHGKSKHSGVWNLKSLFESNRQLLMIDDEKCKIDEFIRPFDGNIQKGLASKALVFDC